MDVELENAHAEIDEAVSLTISTFNSIIYQIGEYRDITSDAFAFLKDDLDRAIKSSDQIAETIIEEYSETTREGILILKTKLREIAEKVNEHLKGKKSEE